MNEKKTANSIVIWRIVFTVLIMIFHFHVTYKGFYERYGELTKGFYIGVEFFFLTSGYLLAAHVERIREKEEGLPSSWQYVWQRLKRLYPGYVMAFFFAWAVRTFYQKPGMARALGNLFRCWDELFMLYMFGSNKKWSTFQNYMSWYVPCLLMAGLVLYYLYGHYKEMFIQLIAPVMIVVFYSYLFRNYGHLDIALKKTEGFYMNPPLMRAFADMSLGMLAHYVSRRYHIWIQERYKWFRLLEVVMYGWVIWYSCMHYHTRIDYLLVLVLTGAVTISFSLESECRLFRNRALNYLSGLTYMMYLLHYTWEKQILPAYFPKTEYRAWWVILYIGLVMISAGVLNEIIVAGGRHAKAK